MRDMVPRQDRSIRNVSMPKGHKHVGSRHLSEEEAEELREGYIPPRRGRQGRRKFLLIALAVVVLCAVAGLLLSTLFAGATVTVFPRQGVIQNPTPLTAQLNAPLGSLAYEIMTVTRSATTTVTATGMKDVSRAASGIITVYNASSGDQRLIANTRFEAPDGKVYRIRDSVVVPSGSAENPGSVSVTVFADSPGAAYNRDETRFTIPGFKSDPRYNQFYAEADAITGGFVGPEPSVAATDLAKGKEALEKSLAQAAQTSLGSQIPTGYLPVPGTLQMTYSDIVQAPGEGNTATLSQSATMSAAIVSGNALASAVTRNAIAEYKNEAVAFTDLSEVAISSPTTTKLTDGQITISFSGSPSITWQYDPGALKQALVGKNKGDFDDIVAGFAPAVGRAEAKIRPFWEGSFPSDPEKIELIEGTE